MIGIGTFGRNNYKLLEQYSGPKIHTQKNDVLNFVVDDCSDEKDVEKGKQVASKLGIEFIQNKGRGIQWCIQTLINKHPELKWMVVYQTDCIPIFLDDTLSIIEELSSDKYNQFGTIGFNVSADDCGRNPAKDKEAILNDEESLWVIGRSPLVQNPPIHWYRASDLDMSSWDMSKPILVEIPSWHVIALNIEKYKEINIQPTDEYHMHYSWDDIAMQFLKNNIPNAMIPWIYCSHNQTVKERYGCSKHSVDSIRAAWNGDKKGIREMGTANHHEVWKKRWGWDYGNKDSYEEVKEKYKETLMDRFRNHNLKNGPLKI